MFIYGHVSAYPAWSVRKSGRPRVSAIFDLLILFPQPGFFFLVNVFCFWPWAVFWWLQLLLRRRCNCCNFLCVSSANALNFDVGQMLALLVAVLSCFYYFFWCCGSCRLDFNWFFFEQLAKIGGKFFVLRSERRCCSKAKVYSSKNHDHELTLQFSCI